MLQSREQKEVKVRIELGPRDAQKSQACLAISITPGEVAKKTIFQVLASSATMFPCSHTVGMSCSAERLKL